MGLLSAVNPLHDPLGKDHSTAKSVRGTMNSETRKPDVQPGALPVFFWNWSMAALKSFRYS
jgi:hypothetical protein